ncbi:MAG: septum formation protein Maf [Flavobacteriaceae bacterium]|nr:septum formation protein Maf [Flavobacteriaceae bacterium]
MLNDLLNNHHLILASGSPRRQNFFRELQLDFEVRVKPVDEIFPEHLKGHEISDYLAKLKASAFEGELKEKDILVTSDTIVWLENEAINKPKDEDDAKRMIKHLSGKTHEVITSVCFKTTSEEIVIHDITKVTFKELSDEEIGFYVDRYKPLDKAGAYGIQDWIGYIGVSRIEGSYFNVMGMPIHAVYETLKAIVSKS